MTEAQGAEIISKLAALVDASAVANGHLGDLVLCGNITATCSGLLLGGVLMAFLWRFFLHGPFQK